MTWDICSWVSENSRPYGCPECGGSLWKMEGDYVNRYRCRVGHAYTAEALVEGMTETAESSLWAAMRSFEERAEVLQGLSRDSSKRGRMQIAARYHEREKQARLHAGQIRKLLLGPEEREPASSAEAAADPSPSS